MAQAASYEYGSDGAKVYSKWSSKRYFVPQPKMNKKGSKIKRNRITFKWKKVSGASTYTVYMRKRGGSVAFLSDYATMDSRVRRAKLPMPARK